MRPAIREAPPRRVLWYSTPALAPAAIQNDLDVRVVKEPLDQMLVKRRFAA